MKFCRSYTTFGKVSVYLLQTPLCQTLLTREQTHQFWMTTSFDKGSTLLESQEEQENSEYSLEYLRGKKNGWMMSVVSPSNWSHSWPLISEQTLLWAGGWTACLPRYLQATAVLWSSVCTTGGSASSTRPPLTSSRSPAGLGNSMQCSAGLHSGFIFTTWTNLLPSAD